MTCLEVVEQTPMDLTFVNNESKKHEGYQEKYRELTLKKGNQSWGGVQIKHSREYRLVTKT